MTVTTGSGWSAKDAKLEPQRRTHSKQHHCTCVGRRAVAGHGLAVLAGHGLAALAGFGGFSLVLVGFGCSEVTGNYAVSGNGQLTAIASQPAMASQWSTNGHPMPNQWPANGQPMANQWPTNGQPVIGNPWQANGQPMASQWPSLGHAHGLLMAIPMSSEWPTNA